MPTQRGEVAVAWERSHVGAALRVTVPANVEAEVHLPDGPRRIGAGPSTFEVASI